MLMSAVSRPRLEQSFSIQNSAFLNCRSLRILQRQAQLLRQRVNRGSVALPGALGLEAQVTDAPAPRGNDAANSPEVRPIRVFLIESTDDIGSDANEGSQGGCGLDAVFAPVPGGTEHLRRLLQVIDEESLGLLAERLTLSTRSE